MLPNIISSRNSASETKTGNALPQHPQHFWKAHSVQRHGNQLTLPQESFTVNGIDLLSYTGLHLTISLERTLLQKGSHLTVFNIKIKELIP